MKKPNNHAEGITGADVTAPQLGTAKGAKNAAERIPESDGGSRADREAWNKFAETIYNTHLDNLK